MHFWDDYETELSIRKHSYGMSELSHVFSWFDPLHFDLALCSFIESLWEEGDSKNEVCQACFTTCPN